LLGSFRRAKQKDVCKFHGVSYHICISSAKGTTTKTKLNDFYRFNNETHSEPSTFSLFTTFSDLFDHFCSLFTAFFCRCKLFGKHFSAFVIVSVRLRFLQASRSVARIRLLHQVGLQNYIAQYPYIRVLSGNPKYR